MSKLLDVLSEFLAHRKGLLPLVGIVLIVINLLLQFLLPVGSFLVATNLFLHIGLIVAIFGLMLAWAL
jgi:membrane-bound ClpP family serine protease